VLYDGAEASVQAPATGHDLTTRITKLTKITKTPEVFVIFVIFVIWPWAVSAHKPFVFC